MGVVDDEVLATVAFEADAVFLTRDHSSVSFGRSAECEVRFGHQPIQDLSVPRVAGAIRALDELIGVHNRSNKIAFDVKTPDGPLETVRPGALLAPSSEHFEILYEGSSGSHLILVQRELEQRRVVHQAPDEGCDDPATRLEPDLRPRQWQMLAAYTEPLRQGRTIPATHKEVADKLHWSYATIRVECNAIWAQFKLAGVPMREFRDKRDAVIDAVTRHNLGWLEPKAPTV